MSIMISCRSCNAQFQVSVPMGTKTVCCQSCQELIVLPDSTGPGVGSNDLDVQTNPSLQESPPAIVRPNSLRSLGIIGLVFLLVLSIGIAYWLRDMFRTKPTAATMVRNVEPPTTKPPAAMSALRFLTADTELVIALQPASIDHYATKQNLTFDQLLTKMGTPGQVGEFIRNLGTSPDRIEQITIGSTLKAIPPGIMITMVFRQEVPEASEFHTKLKKKPLELAGFPLFYRRWDNRTYLFSLQQKTLDTIKPSSDLSHFSASLRESIGQLSPSSFAWVASDSQQWSNNPLISLKPELGKRLQGMTAIAACISTEPGCVASVSIRTIDSKTAEQLRSSLAEKLADVKPSTTTDSNWTKAVWNCEPPENLVRTIQKALGF